ncbi:hypothetical protein VCHENC02_0508A, partial [Vibrio harveyi]
MSRGTGSATLA